MLSNVRIISGIHGSGKTSLCVKLKEILGIMNYTCSGLIKKLDNDRIDALIKNVKDINENQIMLLEALEKNIKEEEIILDSHFCLMDSDYCIKRVPIEVFIQIPISVIVVVKRNPEDIASSLFNRDNKNYSLEFIKKFQEEEISYAREVAELLKVQYVEYNFGEPLDDLIKLMA